MCRKLVYLMVFVLLLGVVGSVWADSLVAHWKLDEGSGNYAYDSAGSNDATLNNMNDEDWGQRTCPELGGTLDFDRVDDYLLVSDDTSIDFSTGSFTIAYWMYSPAGAGGDQIHKGSSIAGGAYSGKRYATSLTGGTLYFSIDDNGPANKKELYTTIPTPLAGVWHHIVCYRDMSDGSIHTRIDGGAGSGNSSGGYNGDISSPGEPLYICRRAPDESPNYFGGMLSDVRLYDYKLSDEEIAALFDYGSLVPWCPDPADGAGNIALDTDFSWNIPSDANDSGSEAWKYEVYLSTDSAFGDVVTPVTIDSVAEQERLTATNAQMGGNLDVDTYYWRVDCYEPNEGTVVTREGTVWTFDAGAVAPVLVSPLNGSTDNEINVDLVWSSDPLVTDSRVYVKVGSGAWNNIGVHTSPFNLYTYGLTDDPDLITMAWDTNYYWKIEELDGGGNPLVMGDEWHFKVRALNCDDPAPLEADLTGNCVVDINDFVILASEWLTCDWDDGGMASPACP